MSGLPVATCTPGTRENQCYSWTQKNPLQRLYMLETFTPGWSAGQYQMTSTFTSRAPGSVLQNCKVPRDPFPLTARTRPPSKPCVHSHIVQGYICPFPLEKAQELDLTPPTGYPPALPATLPVLAIPLTSCYQGTVPTMSHDPTFIPHR